MKQNIKLTLSKRSSLLAVALVAAVVLSATNLPSAQKDSHQVKSRFNVTKQENSRAAFPLDMITTEELLSPIDFSWVEKNRGSEVLPQNVKIISEPTIKTTVETKKVALIKDEVISQAPRLVAMIQENREAPILSQELVVLPVAKKEPLAQAKPLLTLTQEPTLKRLEKQPIQKSENIKPQERGSKVVRTVQVAHKEMKIFEKDLTTLQSWRYAVQVAAVFGGNSSDNLVDHLSEKGYSPIIWESEDSRGRKFQRIWIGLYQNSEKAKEAREYYKKRENKQAFVTPVAWGEIYQASNM